MISTTKKLSAGYQGLAANAHIAEDVEVKDAGEKQNRKTRTKTGEAIRLKIMIDYAR